VPSSLFRTQPVTRRSLREAGVALGVTLEGVDQLLARFARAVDQISGDDRLYEDLLQAARVAQREVQELAPVRTGLLRSAIGAGRGRPELYQRGPSVVVVLNRRRAPHAHLLEYGTRYLRPRPFWRPGLSAVRPMVSVMVLQALEAALQRWAQ